MPNRPLYKHEIVIWSPHNEIELSDLAREADEGDSYCSQYEVTPVPDPLDDGDFPTVAAEFFRLTDEEGN